MNGKNPLDNPQFVREELFATQQALFTAKTVREIQFLQSKLEYLKTKVKDGKKK